MEGEIKEKSVGEGVVITPLWAGMRLKVDLFHLSPSDEAALLLLLLLLFLHQGDAE